MRRDSPKLETLLAHTGCLPEPPAWDLVAPLHMSTTYERGADGSYPAGFSYARNANPTRSRLEEAMARLEGGASAAAFSSGMAATTAIFQALRPGDHILFPDDVYYGVRRLLMDTFQRWGIHYSEADFSRIDGVRAAIRPNTKLIWAETPSNPLSKITDVAAVAELADRSGAALAVDGTWTTPLLQRPLELGAHLVMHSVTKYLGGHSDVLGGVVTCRSEDEFWERITSFHTSGGPVMDPFSAWLAMRGMRSLSARMAVHCRNARLIAERLVGNPKIEAVYYAGLEHHPGHDVAARQMSDFGGMVSVLVKGGAEDALAVAGRVQVFTRATSLGGTESLIEHRASVEMQPSPTPKNLLRLSVGLEHPDDLVADLEQALEG